MGEEGVDDERGEGECEVDGDHERQVDECVCYADEERAARAVVEEGYEREREQAESEVDEDDVARRSAVVVFFARGKTDEE